MSTNELIEYLAKHSASGIGSLRKLFEEANKQTIPFLKEMASYLLQGHLELSIPNELETAEKIAMLANKLIIFTYPSQQMGEVLMIVRRLLFSRQITNQVKRHLMECLTLCVPHQQQSKNYVIESSLKALGELLGERRRSKIQRNSHEKVLADKNGKQFVIKINNSQTDEQIQNLAFMIIESITNSLSKLTDQTSYARKVFLILKQFPAIQGETKEEQSQTLKSKLQFILNIIENIRNAQMTNSQTTTVLQEFFNNIDLHSFLEKSLLYGSIRHSLSQLICPFCVKPELQKQTLSILEIRCLVFSILQKIEGMILTHQCPQLYSQQGENQLIQTILIGIRCFLNFSAQPFQQQQLPLYELSQTLASEMLELYLFLLKKRPTLRRSLFSHTDKVKRLLLFELVKFTNYEYYLFAQQPQTFLSLLSDLRQEKQLAFVKSKTAKILQFIKQILPQSEKYFANFAKYSLFKNNDIYLKDWRKLPNMDEKLSLPTESCYLLFLLFPNNLNITQEHSFFKEIITLHCLERMNNLATTIALVFFTECHPQVFQSVQYKMQIIDLSLASNLPTLKLAALRCLQKISTQIYSARYFTFIVKQVFIHSTSKEEIGNLQKWNILINVVRYHPTALKVYSKCHLLAFIRNQLSSELLLNLKKHPIEQNKLYNCIDLGLELLWNTDYQSVSPYLRRCAIDIASFYPYLPSNSAKEHMLPLISQVLLLESYQKEKISLKLVSFLGELLIQFQRSHDLQILAIFNQYLELFHKKRRPILAQKIRPIFLQFKHYLEQQQQQSNSNESLVYSYLIILNKFVLYFGRSLEDQQIAHLYQLGTKLRKKAGKLIKVRIVNTLFACSLYLPQFSMYPSMLQLTKEGFFQNYEAQSLLRSLEICFSTPYTLGFLQRYQYLFNILYELLLKCSNPSFTIQFPPELQDVFSHFTPTLNSREEFRQECCHIYRLFKLNKNPIYLYIMDYIEPEIRLYFISLDVTQKADQISPNNYNQQEQEQLQTICPLLPLCNPFRRSFKITYHPSSHPLAGMISSIEKTLII